MIYVYKYIYVDVYYSSWIKGRLPNELSVNAGKMKSKKGKPFQFLIVIVCMTVNRPVECVDPDRPTGSCFHVVCGVEILQTSANTVSASPQDGFEFIFSFVEALLLRALGKKRLRVTAHRLPLT